MNLRTSSIDDVIVEVPLVHASIFIIGNKVRRGQKMGQYERKPFEETGEEIEKPKGLSEESNNPRRNRGVARVKREDGEG